MRRPGKGAAVFERILCSVDQSEYSRRTARLALALGERHRSTVTVLSIRKNETFALWDARSAGSIASSDERAAQELMEFAKSASGLTPSNAVVIEGAIVPTILHVAHEVDADLLVVGLHGPPSGFQELLLSPVTERIVAKARCPVLAVARRPPEYADGTDGTFRTIVCGVDRSSTARRALERSMTLAQESGARLIVVHALADMHDEDPQIAAGHFNSAECWREVGPAIRASYERLIPERLRERCSVDIRTPVGEPATELLTIAKDSRADLIVLGASGWHGGLGVTRQVLRQTLCETLIVPSELAAAQS
jgi:nucleotide-binding universal stress UspA family protein